MNLSLKVNITGAVRGQAVPWSQADMHGRGGQMHHT